MEEDWRPKVEAHRPQIVLKIKQKLEKLVAPGGDDAARETKLNHIATQFETMQWRDASTRHDYTERITKKLKELEAQVPAAVPAPGTPAVPAPGPQQQQQQQQQLQEAQQHRDRALQEQAQREAHRRRQQEDAGRLMKQHQAQAAAQLLAQQPLLIRVQHPVPVLHNKATHL